MDRSIVSLMISGTAILSSCGPAQAISPDSTKPAHCVAAQNIWMGIFERGGEHHQALSMKARILWELDKIKAAGQVSSAHEESRVLTKQLLEDSKAADALAKACSLAEEADPAFEKANVELMARAKAQSNGS